MRSAAGWVSIAPTTFFLTCYLTHLSSQADHRAFRRLMSVVRRLQHLLCPLILGVALRIKLDRRGEPTAVTHPRLMACAMG